VWHASIEDGEHLGGALSANFGHLEEISPELHRLGTLAERFFAEDANTSLIKSRQFGEYMVKEVAALAGVYDPATRETTNDLLRRLATQQVLPREVADIFHAVRKSGNDATHNLTGSPAEALAALKFCRALGVWYRRTYGRDPNFNPISTSQYDWMPEHAFGLPRAENYSLILSGYLCVAIT
jgi:type I restriction enzyme R subunit